MIRSFFSAEEFFICIRDVFFADFRELISDGWNIDREDIIRDRTQSSRCIDPYSDASERKDDEIWSENDFLSFFEFGTLDYEESYHAQDAEHKDAGDHKSEKIVQWRSEELFDVQKRYPALKKIHRKNVEYKQQKYSWNNDVIYDFEDNIFYQNIHSYET